MGAGRRALFRSEPAAEADVRPTLLGVVTLLFLLLFFLLATSSGQRLGTISLRMGGAADLAPLPHTGLLRSLRLDVTATSVAVAAEVATTDIAASATTSELRTWSFPAGDLTGLDSTLAELHSLDPAQERATVAPTDDVSTDTLMAVLDVVRGSQGEPRFRSIALAGTSP